MHNIDYKMPAENSTGNIFANFSIKNLKNFYSKFIKKIEENRIRKAQNQYTIGEALAGKNFNYYNPNNNISVFSKYNNSAEETERQYIAATRVLIPVKIDPDLLKEMEKFNLIDD